jgi:hypothetical protein
MPALTRDTCPQCQSSEQLLYLLEPTDESLGLACPECIRKAERGINRTTPCDDCGKPGAWRDPKTRRNEYFCGVCHVKHNPQGVFLNRWFVRQSEPHSLGRKVKCAVADNNCRGEVKPSGPGAQLLCRRHAGKKSAAWAVEDKEV